MLIAIWYKADLAKITKLDPKPIRDGDKVVDAVTLRVETLDRHAYEANIPAEQVKQFNMPIGKIVMLHRKTGPKKHGIFKLGKKITHEISVNPERDLTPEDFAD